MSDIGKLVGLTLKYVDGLEVNSDQVTLVAEDGRRFRMYHSQDCCETVQINDVIGDPADLIGSPILRAEERESDEPKPDGYYDSYTWTFYEIASNKGTVTIRWLGESNGYYSENVDFFEVAA